MAKTGSDSSFLRKVLTSKARRDYEDALEDTPQLDLNVEDIQAAPEQAESLELLREQADRKRLPGQTQLERQLATTGAQAATQAQQAAGSGADLLRSIGAINRNQTVGMQNIGIEAARQQAAAEQRLAGGLQTAARYRTNIDQLNRQMQMQSQMAEFEANEWLPWQQKQNFLQSTIQQQRQLKGDIGKAILQTGLSAATAGVG